MDDINASLAGFDALWQRVTGHEPRPALPPAFDPEDALLGFIQEETCAAARSAALARQFQGEPRAALQRQTELARQHVRRLRAERFIITGLAGADKVDCRMPAEKPAALRAAYLRAAALAERYDAAAHAAGGELAELFTAFAADARVRARELRALVVACF